MPALSDTVPVPHPEEMNAGLSPASESLMLKKFGRPGEMTSECSDPLGRFRKRMRWNANLGPFRVSGLDYAVNSLSAIFGEVRVEMPDIYRQVRTAGMLCVRHKRKSHGSYSNHSWGTAIDLYFGEKVVEQGVPLCHQGILLLYPYFHRHGWYWGAGFPGERVDSMHFELAAETIKKLPDRPLHMSILERFKKLLNTAL